MGPSDPARRRFWPDPRRAVGVAALVLGVVVLAIVGLGPSADLPRKRSPHGSTTVPGAATATTRRPPRTPAALSATRQRGAEHRLHPVPPGQDDHQRRQACWYCHRAGRAAAPATNEGCTSVTASVPHLGASLGSAPAAPPVTRPTPRLITTPWYQTQPQACTDCQHGRSTHDRRTARPATPPTSTPPSRRCPVPATPATPRDVQRTGGLPRLPRRHPAPSPARPTTTSTTPRCPTRPSARRAAPPATRASRSTRDGRLHQCHTRRTPSTTAPRPARASSPALDCHGQKKQHGAGLPCLQCHPNAMHLAKPAHPRLPRCATFCHAPAGVGDRRLLRVPYRCRSTTGRRRCPPVPVATRGSSSHAGQSRLPDLPPKPARFHHGGTQPTASSRASAATARRSSTARVSPAPAAMRRPCTKRPPIPTARAAAGSATAPDQFGTALLSGATPQPIYHVPPACRCSRCHPASSSTRAEVDCRQCHTNIPSGHHIGRVGIPSCQRRLPHAAAARRPGGRAPLPSECATRRHAAEPACPALPGLPELPHPRHQSGRLQHLPRRRPAQDRPVAGSLHEVPCEQEQARGQGALRRVPHQRRAGPPQERPGGRPDLSGLPSERPGPRCQTGLGERPSPAPSAIRATSTARCRCRTAPAAWTATRLPACTRPTWPACNATAATHNADPSAKEEVREHALHQDRPAADRRPAEPARRGADHDSLHHDDPDSQRRDHLHHVDHAADERRSDDHSDHAPDERDRPHGWLQR